MIWNQNIASIILNSFIFIILVVLIWKNKQLGRNIWIFIIAVSVNLLVELLVFYLSNVDENFMSYPVYAVGKLLFFFFVVYLYYYKMLTDPVLRRIQKGIILLFFLNYFSSLFFYNSFFAGFPFITFFINDVLLLISIVLFIYEVFNTDVIFKLKNYYPFWICLALIVIYVGILPLVIINSQAAELVGKNIFFILNFCINMIGYAILLTGVFFSKERTETVKNYKSF